MRRVVANATDPFEVGRVIEHAITTDRATAPLPGELGRCRDGRVARSHRLTPTGSNSVRSEDDADYIDRFREIFGIDISL